MYDIMFHHIGDNNPPSLIASYSTLTQARKEMIVKRQQYINAGYDVRKDDHIKDRINVYSSYTGKYRLSLYIT